MKKSSPIFRMIFGTFLAVVVFSTNNYSQQIPAGNSFGTIQYIASEDNSSTVPKIRIIKSEVGHRYTKIVSNLKPTDFTLEKKAFNLINEKRIEKGLKHLHWNEKLAELARRHSENMAKFDFFSHAGVDGEMVDQRAFDLSLNKWNAIGENIAFNQGFENPADFAVERWMLSESHCRNLLDTRWRESGIGVGITENGKYFFTQVFLVK